MLDTNEKRFGIRIGGVILGSYPHEPDILFSVSLSEQFIKTYREYIGFNADELAEFTREYVINTLEGEVIPHINDKGSKIFKALIERVYRGETDNLPTCQRCCSHHTSEGIDNYMGSYRQTLEEGLNPGLHHR